MFKKFKCYDLFYMGKYVSITITEHEVRAV